MNIEFEEGIFLMMPIHQIVDLFGFGVRIEDYSCMPDCPGLYLVVSDKGQGIEPSNVLYVGMAGKSIKTRWRNHHKIPALKLLERIGLDLDVYTYPLPPAMFSDTTICAWEQELIKRFDPPLNNNSLLERCGDRNAKALASPNHDRLIQAEMPQKELVATPVQVLLEEGQPVFIDFKKADMYAHGGKKKQYQFMLTEEASEMVDAKADALGISRSELFERVIRSGGLDAADNFEASEGDRNA